MFSGLGSDFSKGASAGQQPFCQIIFVRAAGSPNGVSVGNSIVSEEEEVEVHFMASAT